MPWDGQLLLWPQDILWGSHSVWGQQRHLSPEISVWVLENDWEKLLAKCWSLHWIYLCAIQRRISVNQKEIQNQGPKVRECMLMIGVQSPLFIFPCGERLRYCLNYKRIHELRNLNLLRYFCGVVSEFLFRLNYLDFLNFWGLHYKTWAVL